MSESILAAIASPGERVERWGVGKSNPKGMRRCRCAPRITKVSVFLVRRLQFSEIDMLEADNRSDGTDHALSKSTIAVPMPPIHPKAGHRRELLPLYCRL